MPRSVLCVAVALAVLGGDALAKPKRRRLDPKSAVKKPEPAKPGPAEAKPKEPHARPDEPQVDVSDRIEFDERLVGGQTAKPGTVRLFERRDSDLQTMVRTRRRFRSAIVRSILGAEPARKETR